MQVVPESVLIFRLAYVRVCIYICTHLSLGGASTTSNNKPSLSLEKKQGNERGKDFFLLLLSSIRSRSIISTLVFPFFCLLAMLKGERTLLTETGKWDDRTFISSFIHLQSIFHRSKKKRKN
jgi:hypothetical protein